MRNAGWVKPTYLFYKNKGLEDGLRSFLAILFIRCNFDEISFSENITTAFRNVITGELTKNTSLCKHLSVKRMRPDHEIIVKALNCHSLNAKTGYRAGSLMADIEEVVKWNRHIKLYIHLKELNTLVPVLENWEKGQLSLNCVELSSSTECGAFYWYNASLEPMRAFLDQGTSQYEKDENDGNLKRIYRIPRRFDAKICFSRPFSRPHPLICATFS